MTEAMKTRKERMIELRKQGMTYREIAENFGVSHQRVYHLIGGNYRKSRLLTEEDCVYEGLRNWMNEHDVSATALVRKMYDGTISATNISLVKRLMRGVSCQKRVLDRLLRATGLTYEQAFGGADDGENEADRASA